MQVSETAQGLGQRRPHSGFAPFIPQALGGHRGHEFEQMGGVFAVAHETA